MISLAYSSDTGMKVRYSGHTVELHHSYPDVLQSIQKEVEEFLGEKFNHIMLNRYQSGEEYIGRHRDTNQNRVGALVLLLNIG
jgi:alkylated DNA repair dioxygenase AlkB